MKFQLPLLILPVCLAGCVASDTGTPRSSGTAAANPAVRTAPAPAAIPPTRPAPPVSGFRTPKVMNIPGLEGVIGQGVAGLQRQFGEPRLNVIEGDVRKLQFGGEACVLDIYLYPQAPGAEPQATYLDARRSSDGLDVDRLACVNALKAAR